MDQSTRVRILHVSASPTDVPFHPSWEAAKRDAPWLRDDHLRHLARLDPSVDRPLVTSIASNHAAWPSISDYMTELDTDPAAQALLDLVNNRGETFDASRDYAEAEASDAAREIHLFSWRRPIVRIASHVVVEARAIDEDATARVLDDAGPCVLTGGDGTGVGFLFPGGRAGALLHLRRALFPTEGWTPWR